MNCLEAQSVMHAYLDGELQAPAILQYEEHVGECPACCRLLAEHKELQTGMKNDVMYYKAPERLRASLRQQHGEPRRLLGWRWIAMAACLLLCVGFGFLLARLVMSPTQHEHLAQEVLAAHIRSLQVDKSRLVDVRSSDRHEVKPWFNDKLNFSPSVPDLANQGFALVGGRLDYLDGRPVASLVYKRRQHLINVFIWPDPNANDTRPRHEARQGFQLVSWSGAGMNFWVVSDLNSPELDELVQQLRSPDMRPGRSGVPAADQ
jgi:anti-sigma factor RsiW